MKRAVLFIIFLLFLTSAGFAKSRTSSEALSIAGSFCRKSQSTIKKMSLEGITLKLVYTCTDSIATRSSSGNVYYYVFNIENSNGFVIVSGDDRAKDILGYSDSGSFDINSLPPNFVYWLGCYQQELKELMEQPETTSTIALLQLSAPNEINVRQASYATSVAPLLGGIKWNQDSPYNNFCPIINTSTSERAVTGCIATAMSQVMRYYKWPVQGTGSNTYTPKRLTTPLTVDFSQTTYDWANMSETYNSSSTQVQKDAVATLMYHAGVAVNMDYGTTSGADDINMARALMKNFGYDSNIQYYMRDFYTRSEWIDFLKAELNVQHPVLYRGQSTDVGHMFVCDGYDNNSLFHFNWGWGGSSDGYFELSALNPGSLGIGGGNSGGFNSVQAIVLGVQKPSALSIVPPSQLYLYSPLTTSVSLVNRVDSFTTNMNLYNRGINIFSGSIGIALYNNTGFIKLIDSFPVASLDSDWGWNNLSYNSNIPSLVADGSYKLYSVYKATEQTDWLIMRGKVGTPNYLNVTVTPSNVSFTNPDVLPKLTLNSLTVTGNLYQNKTGRFNVSITNNGGEYNSVLVIYLQSVTSSTVKQIVSNDPINIPVGETKNFDLTGDILLVAGQYNLFAMYDPVNDRSNVETVSSIGDSLTVNVLAEPTEAPVMTLASQISFPDPIKVNKSNAVLTAHIKNTGGYFYNKVVAFVFPITGGASLTYFGYQPVILDKNEEREITFSGNIDLDPGSYITAIRYWNLTTSAWGSFDPGTYGQISFILVNDAIGMEQTTQIKPTLYPNPATVKLCLQSEEVVKIIRITDVSGKQVLLIKPEMSGEIIIPVERLSAGTYILQSETATGTQVSKFIKK